MPVLTISTSLFFASLLSASVEAAPRKDLSEIYRRTEAVERAALRLQESLAGPADGRPFFAFAPAPSQAAQPPEMDSQAAKKFWEGNFECSLVSGCGGLFPVRSSDSQLSLLDTAEDSLAARIQTLAAARRSVRIQALIFKNDEAGRAIVQALKQKKRDGVDVRLIVDAFSNLDLPTQFLYYDLKQHGIEVEGYEALLLQWVNEVSLKDPRRPDKRFHDKMWVIDAEDPERGIAIVGGRNIANEYFRTGPDAKHLWRDQDVMLRGAVVSDVAAAFDRNYRDQKEIKRSRPGLFNTDAAWELWRKQAVARYGLLRFRFKAERISEERVRSVLSWSRGAVWTWAPARIRFIQSRPRYGETFIRDAYESLFRAARKELLVVNAYFIPEERIRRELAAAARRGAVVTVITNSPETNDLPEMAYASRYLYRELLAVNEDPATKVNGGALRIFEWNGHRFGEGTLHAKFAVADRFLSICGSYNLDARSETLNSETVAAFENAPLSAELASQVFKEYLPKSRVITPEMADEYHNPRRRPDMLQLLLWNGLRGEL